MKNRKNKIGLSNDTYKNLLNKAGSIASGAVGGVWGAAVGLLNSMLLVPKQHLLLHLRQIFIQIWRLLEA